MLRLFDYFRSSASYRVRIALHLKGLDYERVDVSLVDGSQRSAAHLARNPQGFVPALEVDGRILTQSLAIIEWLDGAHSEPRLIPGDPFERARVMAQAMVIACDIHPLGNLRVLKYLKNEFGADDQARDAWYQRWVHDGFAALEDGAGDGPFLGGAAPNLADVFLVPQMFNARRFGTDLAAYPRLVAIDAALTALPAFAAAHPSKFEPAPAG